MQRLSLSRRSFLAVPAAAIAGAAGRKLLAQGPFPIYETPSLTCVSSTVTTITLMLTANASSIRMPGAPNGFRVFWGGDGSACTTGDTSSFGPCSALVAGNFGPGTSINITIGAVPPNGFVYDDPRCAIPLNCGAAYNFVAVALGDPSGPNVTSHPACGACSTQPCASNCTFTQGYWKNHPSVWPVSSLTLGTVSYTKDQLLAILNEPVRGNGLVSLAHQLIAAKLNAANGTTCPGARIADADVAIGALVVPPVGSGSLQPQAVSALVTNLDNFNSGLLPGCPSECN